MIGRLVTLVTFLTCAAATGSVTPLWQQYNADEGFWFAAFAGTQGLLVGTFGEVDCKTVIYSTSNDMPPTNTTVPGLCQVGARGSAAGFVGYHYPTLHALVRPAQGADFTHEFGGQYYPAFQQPSMALTGGDMLVWGSRPGKININDEVACLYSMPLHGGTVTKGPCLSNFGDGESAEVIQASDDGTVVLLTAGHK
jgi:hypothetical protein